MKLPFSVRGLARAWLAARSPAHSGPMRLPRRRLYILPTGFGLAYAGVAVALLIAAINYGSSMVFVLSFVLGAVGLVAMHHAHANLLGLELDVQVPPPGFAGARTTIPVRVRNGGRRTRCGLRLRSEHGTAVIAELVPGASELVHVPFELGRRGRQNLPALQVSSEHPLALFRVWSWLRTTHEALAYPQPTDTAPAPAWLEGTMRPAPSARSLPGSEDFADLRPYQVGDSWRHIAWKASARDGVWRTKRFSAAAAQARWLDADALGTRDVELTLSLLTRQVLDCAAEERTFGLRLARLIVPPGEGGAHCRTCLQALALYEPADAARRRG
ncbi:MAG: DUF58 domain-containing protein [Pseudomonadota bacterium]|nr:DUF58 domain-containing protein [Pseudomonadota bacterium]